MNLLKKPKDFFLFFKKRFLSYSKKKKIIISIVVIAVLLLFFRLITGSKKPQYTFDTVSRGTVTEEVTETGNVLSNGQTDVFSPASGTISALYVKNGDMVEVGQKLFSVTSNATPIQQAAAYTAYLQAKSVLDNATATQYALQSSLFAKWKIYTDLATNSTYQNSDGSPNTSNRTLPQFTTAQDDWLSAQAQYKNQQGVIVGSQASVTANWLAYQATQNALVSAPVSGTVQNLAGVLGSQISASNNTALNPTPALIISNSNVAYSVQTQVNEVDINKIKVNDTVSITFDAIKNQTFRGKVTQVDSYGTNTQGVINYNVFVSIDNSSNLIKPGMTANLTINTDVRRNVLTVANAAVKPYRGGKAVQVLSNGKIKYIPVLVGLKGILRIEILKGLSLGQKVILNNQAPKPVLGGGQPPA